tara:strand:- start:193 stop:381 length:189 start_codon:yes stop_codon:yes gene_type:complete
MAEGLSRSNSSFLPPASTGGKMVNIDHTNQNGWGGLAPLPPKAKRATFLQRAFLFSSIPISA